MTSTSIPDRATASVTRPPLFTLEQRATPLDYRGLQHARSTEKMEEMGGVELPMLLRLRRKVGDNGRIRIRGGIRGLSRWFGYDHPNGNMYKRLAKLAAPEWDFIAYEVEPNGDTVITVLPPEELRASAGAPGPVVEATPPDQDEIDGTDQHAIKRATPAPQQEAAAPTNADPTAIPMNHDQYQQEGEEKAPTALLAPEQALLYNALLAEGVKSRSHALAAAQALPDRTIADFRDQVAYAAACGKEKPLHYVIALWADGQQFRRPPRKEASPPPTQKGQPDGPQRSAPASPAPNRDVSRPVSPPPGLKLARVRRASPAGTGSG